MEVQTSAASMTRIDADNVSGCGSGSDDPTIKKKQRLSNGQKTCRVCGDRALAHNFDVVSCESCKAFFRRNALKTKAKPCAFNGDCDVTPQTRRFCLPCRLRKCLACGMNPDMILGDEEKQARQSKVAEKRRDEEKQARQSKVAENRRKKEAQQTKPTLTSATTCPPLTSATTCPPLTSATTCPPLTSATTCPPLPDVLMSSAWASASTLDPGQDRLVVSSSTAFSSPSPVGQASPDSANTGADAMSQAQPFCLDSVTKELTLLDHSSLVYSRCDSTASGSAPSDFEIYLNDATFQQIQREQLPSDLRMYWLLKDEERALLAELTLAYQETILKLPEAPAGTKPLTLETFFEKFQSYVLNVVNFVKRVPDYRSLRVADQLAVLKGSAWRTFLIKCAATYIVEIDGWRKEVGSVSIDQMVQLSPENEHQTRLLGKFSSSLKQIIRGDPTAFTLLQVLMLFDPKDPGLQERQRVSQLSDKYSLLLKHYLESVWSYHHAGHYLNAIRERLQHIPRVSAAIETMFLGFSDHLEPLVQELMNFK